MPECPVCGSTEPHKDEVDFWECERDALVEYIEQYNQQVFEDALETIKLPRQVGEEEEGSDD